MNIPVLTYPAVTEKQETKTVSSRRMHTSDRQEAMMATD